MKDYTFARIKQLANEIANVLQIKNMQYGDSFSKAPKILEILYPEGIRPNQYKDLLTIVRILDKINRISGGKGETEDPYKDIAGYGILAQVLHEEENKEKLAMARACEEAKNRIYKECDHDLDVKKDGKKV